MTFSKGSGRFLLAVDWRCPCGRTNSGRHWTIFSLVFHPVPPMRRRREDSGMDDEEEDRVMNKMQHVGEGEQQLIADIYDEKQQEGHECVPSAAAPASSCTLFLSGLPVQCGGLRKMLRDELHRYGMKSCE